MAVRGQKLLQSVCQYGLLFLIVLAGYVSLSKNLPTVNQAGKHSVEVMGGFVSAGANSGKVFGGEPFRSFAGPRVFEKGWEQRMAKKSLTWDQIASEYLHETPSSTSCTKWAVVTTIFKATDAIRDVGSLGNDWCLVIVGDNKTPADWLSSEPDLAASKSVFFLDVQKQKQWDRLPGDLGEFVRALPYDHFSRKNLGFLYAILRGASFIYDFDDDNYIKKDVSGELINLIPDDQGIENVRFVSIDSIVFNHHPLMGATVDTSWPRGFPLESIQNSTSNGQVQSSNNYMPMDHVGVIQYCADQNPDVDAIHRLTKPLPMSFESSASPIRVPLGTYTPYNAQATLHTYPALFATMLPYTVESRVTDIWRAYYALALFHQLDLALIIAPPKLNQYRNPHSYIGDMKAESDLYYKSAKLVEFLRDWSCSEGTVPACMEALWIDLYSRGYHEEGDVYLVQKWLGALATIQYNFPHTAGSS